MVAKETLESYADIQSHDVYEKEIPHATFQYLRREDPVAWYDEKQGSGFWAITKHADISNVVRDYETFTSSQGIRLEDMSDDETIARRTLMEIDPPEHRQMRQIVNKGFSRKMVAGYEDQIRQLAINVIEEAVKNDEFDFVNHIAKRVPMAMLANLLGVPEEDGLWLTDQGDKMIGNSDPDFSDYVVDKVDTEEFRLLPFRSPAALELFKYAEKQMELRRDKPHDDVINILINASSGDRPLSDLEFKNFFSLLVAAGNDTTRYTIASSMLALIQHPEKFDYLSTVSTADSEQWNKAVEELIRWASATMYFRRTATRDVELRGKQIKQGDKVVVWFISGNFDEDVFENPYELNLQRDNNAQISFGRGGPHSCLGMWLARMELRLVLQEFIMRVKTVEQAAPEKRLRSNFINGIKSLPIKITRR